MPGIGPAQIDAAKEPNDNLTDPKLVEVFCKEYTAHINRLRMEHNATIAAHKKECDRLVQREKRIMNIAIDGYGNDTLKQESIDVQTRRKELDALLATNGEAPVLLDPNMAGAIIGESKIWSALFMMKCIDMRPSILFAA